MSFIVSIFLFLLAYVKAWPVLGEGNQKITGKCDAALILELNLGIKEEMLAVNLEQLDRNKKMFLFCFCLEI